MSELVMSDSKTTSNSKKGRRRSLGGKRAQTSAMDMASDALKRMEEVNQFISKDRRDIAYVSPDEIKKTFNARFIPCSLQEFQSIDWPALELDVDSASATYPVLLSDKEWYVELDETEQQDFLLFLADIHTTAQSMISSIGQVQPITLEREHEEATESFIVDGERRTLSCLYSKGEIPVIKAQVYNYILDALERALIKDIANSGVPLNTYEKILSKKAIFEAMENIETLSLRDLGKLIGYGKDQAKTIRDIFTHQDSERVLVRMRKEKLSWRNIRFILDKGVDAEIVAPEKVSDSKTKAESAADSNASGTQGEALVKDPSILRLETDYSAQVGFPCVIKQNQKSGTMKVQFSCSAEQFDEMMANIKRLKVQG